MKRKFALMVSTFLAVALAVVMQLGRGSDATTSNRAGSETAAKAVASFQEQAKKLGADHSARLKALADLQGRVLDEASKNALERNDLREATELLTAKVMIQSLAGAKPGGAPSFTFQTFTWMEDKPPTKMIHQDEGFCFLTGVNGAFDGGAEGALVYIGEDGYWYLKGHTKRELLRLHAIAVKIQR